MMRLTRHHMGEFRNLRGFMKRTIGVALGVVVAGSVAIAAQWPKITDPSVPRDAQGKIQMDAPTPRTADGKPDLSGMWMRANSGPPNEGRGRGRGGQGAGAPGAAGGGAAGAAAAAPAPGPPPAASPGAAAWRGGDTGPAFPRGGPRAAPPHARTESPPVTHRRPLVHSG